MSAAHFLYNQWALQGQGPKPMGEQKRSPSSHGKDLHALLTTERFKGSVVGRAREHAAWGERSLTTGTGTESQVLEEVSQDRVL